MDIGRFIKKRDIVLIKKAFGSQAIPYRDNTINHQANEPAKRCK
jgi:hypothetical protein